jgi:hypothetical protein
MEAYPTTLKVATEEVSKTPVFPNSKILVALSFPGRLAKRKKEKVEHEIL